ncbi:MAG: hypothetical protein ABW250_08445 [Pyrinomonadaceae bacterium]
MKQFIGGSSEGSKQMLALVLAETFEQVRYAARLVKATYNEEKSVTRVEDVLGKAYVPPRGARGNPVEAMKSAPVKIEDVETLDGKLQFNNDPSRSVNIAEKCRPAARS